jgi:hypothetical protein
VEAHGGNAGQVHDLEPCAIGRTRRVRTAPRKGTTVSSTRTLRTATTTSTDVASFTVHFVLNDRGTPEGKLADAELHFAAGPLDGLKLIGFAVWQRRGGGRNVTVPARQYSVNGERRSFALLRPIADSIATDRLRDIVLDAFAAYEATQEGGAL